MEYVSNPLGSPIQLSEQQVKQAVSSFTTKTFAWMMLALLLTAATAVGTVATGLIETLMANRLAFYAIIGLELGLVVYLSARIERMSVAAARLSFLGYSLLTGVTFSTIFLAYRLESILLVFGVSALLFGIMAAYGYFTKADLSSMRSILMMGLIGIILMSLVNWFVGSDTLNVIISFVGVAVFVGLTAYDAQRIKDMAIATLQDSTMQKKGAIMGALALYLDLINLFLMLLRLFGDRR